MNPIISASILSANFAYLGKEVKDILHAGADQIHFDVMDFHYVPNLTFGPIICQALRNDGVQAPIDVHLMVENPDQYIEPFAKAGANTVIIHSETTPNPQDTLKRIHDHGMQAGLAYNPKQTIPLTSDLLTQVDMILIMTVEPGFGGQEFMPSCFEKITATRKWIDENQFAIKLGVDGGIKVSNIASVAKAGADFFVVGSGLFGAPDYHKRAQELRSLCNV